MGFLKLAVTWPIRRLFKRMGKRLPVIVCTVLLGTEAVWTVAACVVLSIGCPAEHVLPEATPKGMCGFGVSTIFHSLYFEGRGMARKEGVFLLTFVTF